MQKKETTDEIHARGVLESAGLTVERLETDDVNPTADYRVVGQDAACLVEVKAREVSEFVRDLAKTAERDGVASDGRAMVRKNTVAGILSEASQQVVVTRGRGNATDFGIIWISCLHQDAGYLLDQCFRTLYGFASINVFDDRGVILRASKPCFYYCFNSFFDLPGIEGAVLASRSATTLCLNSHAPRYVEFARSSIARSPAWSRVIDPLEAERCGDAFVIDGAVNRRDPHALWKAIKDKYGVLNSPMAEVQWLGMAAAGASHE